MTITKYRAPTRIDIAGGTIDIHPTYLLIEDALTVNMAIELFAEVKVSPRKDGKVLVKSEDLDQLVQLDQYDQLDKVNPKKYKKLELIIRALQWAEPKAGLTIETNLQTPLGSGLGSSSSLLVSLLSALTDSEQISNKKFASRVQIIEVAAEIEAQALSAPTGKQDHAAAVFGGVASYGWDVDTVERENLVKQVNFSEIEERLILSYSGESRFSGNTNLDMTINFLYGQKETISAMKKINDISHKAAEIFKSEEFDKLADILSEEWELRKSLAKGITTLKVEKIIKAAVKAGAKANKLTGAGGGGCLVTYADPSKRQQVTLALKSAGSQILPFKISKEGVKKLETI